jgi:hypothetical protein
MDRNEIIRALDEVRRNVGDSAASAEILPATTRLRGRASDWHQVAFSALTDATADAVIAGEVAHYRALKSEVEWTVYGHDLPADLLSRLERHGFHAGPREVVLVLDLARLPAWVLEPPSVRVERVTTDQLLDEFGRVSEGAFERKKDQGILLELSAALRAGSEEQLGYLAFDADRAVSVGRLNTTPASPFGGLYGGGTLPSHRGRGFYRATVAARARDAARLGARYLRVDALPTSQPILERLGFLRVTETLPCVLAAE